VAVHRSAIGPIVEWRSAMMLAHTRLPLLPTDKPNHLLGIADEESPEQARATTPR
jgi:hypothetical protein